MPKASSLAQKSRKTHNPDRARMEMFEAIPEVAPRIYTATGPIAFKDAVGLAMPWRLGFIYSRELACKTIGRNVSYRTSFVRELPSNKYAATLTNNQQAMLYSLAVMTTTDRLGFLAALCDFINDVDDATGLETILSSTMDTVWAFCDDELAAYAERTWLRYAANGGLAEREGILALNMVNTTVEFFDAKDVRSLNLERNIRIRPNGAFAKLNRYGRIADRTPGQGQTTPGKAGTLGQDRTHGSFGSYDGPGAGTGRPDENEYHGPGQGSGYGAHQEGGFGSYGGPGAGTGRPDENEYHGPGQGSSYGAHQEGSIGSYDGPGAGIGRPSDEFRGRGQGDTYGQPRKQTSAEAYTGIGADSIGRTGSGMGSELLSGPFGRGKSPAEQSSDKDQRFSVSQMVYGIGVTTIIGGTLAAAGGKEGAALALGLGAVCAAFGLVGMLYNQKPDTAPPTGPADSSGGPAPQPEPDDTTPVVHTGGSSGMPNPDDPNDNNPRAASGSSGMPNPDDPTGGRNPHANVYFPAPDDVGGGGPNSRAASFPSSRDYYPAPDGGGYVGPRGAGVTLVPMALAFGDGLQATLRVTGTKSARIGV